MKKGCLHWKSYESIAGHISYCEIEAFNKKTTQGYLEAIGCKKMKQERCLAATEREMGARIKAEPAKKKETAASRTGAAETRKGVATMKKAVGCRNWNENDGIGGTVMFCSAGAYGRALTGAEARELRCSALQREKCLELMTRANGFGLVPEVEAAEVKTAREMVFAKTG